MSERDWISRYFAPLATAPGAAGLRDDVAELSGGDGRLIATTDALVEGVHFLPDDPIDTIARKLVRTNVSDVLSKGALPEDVLLTLGWPNSRPESEIAAFASALGDDLETFGARLVGGDTVRSRAGLFLSLTLTGRCLCEHPVRRSGAAHDQDIWVTGEMGAACLGFEALQRGECDSPHVAVYRVPRLQPVSAAHLIANHASAAMDVSDGLLGDASALGEASGVGMKLALEEIRFAGKATDIDTMLRLATWGDDYQILFTSEKTRRETILADADDAGVSVARIGETSQKTGLSITWRGEAVNLPETLGFEHG
ncbi:MULTISPECIES: thiamine-phosphate kinase [Hyphomonas]|uniref:Thiamine-monophosphate kinase n=1 Tax=Hyphomonas atlantica TaxID=1280948 RepID=A0A059E0M3_9PROT|nr:thiamine-phosphate kinase [Hyphomonas atlantica]KCZ60453.1 hypothetical protein HY36_05595 [Hyphomonas atlantica]